ncbi:branched-chain amino acid transport system II carrier protein [Eupransor demetentiae]|uniref:Branched-chain amino acid transport system carrier protein n=1 Tax=Eupransor demetentiae TaxID=3109584 RepID=A0ABP0EQJ6_9LACO|nr:Branched-chain amino acid permease (BrnQ) [Lactobacillaceae bacterium LMG 33000]
MTKKLSWKQTLLLVSLIFGMFFGAGNLIFPVHLGQLAAGHWLPATIGFVLSATMVPLLALIAFSTSKSESIFDLVKPLGGGLAIFFLIAVHVTMGPLVATPRAASIVYSLSFANWLPQGIQGVSQVVFFVLYFGLLYWVGVQKQSLTVIIGKYLNPIFIVLLAFIFILGILHPMGSLEHVASAEYQRHAFTAAFLEGYNTVDIFSSLIFGISIVQAINAMGFHGSQTTGKIIAKTGTFAMLGLALFYLGLILLGATSLGKLTVSDNGAQGLTQIVTYYLGSFGQAFLAVTAFLAVFTSAMGLTSSFAQDFHKIFPKVSYKVWLAFTVILAFLVANLGLDNIIAWTMPFLIFLYPLAIVLTILGLLAPWLGRDKILYQTTMFFTLFPAILDGLVRAPFAKSIGHLVGYLDQAGHLHPGLYQELLPGASVGFGWVLPAIIGFALGLILSRYHNKKAN